MDNNNYNNRQGGSRTSRKNDYSNDPYRRTQRVSVNSGRGGEGGGHKRKRRIPVALAIVIDVFIGALLLLVFYITTYLINPEDSGTQLPVPSSYISAATASPTGTASNTSAASIPTGSKTTAPSATPTVTADQTSWRTKFADNFTSGAVEQTATSYKSANINVSIEKKTDNGVVYFIVDIYVADIKYFKTAFAKSPGDVFGYREFVDVVAKEQGAVIAINGDHCIDNKAYVIRNGKEYLKNYSSSADYLLMNNDGTMQTFSSNQLDKNKIQTEGAYQLWTFGPMLLNDGQPMTTFNTPANVAGPNNPRTAIGYYEPGHYCFVVVDGRQQGYSYPGYSLEQLSQLFYSLGCKVAFNLDGGQSTELVYNNNGTYSYVNQPYNGGRSTGDIVYITDK